MTAADHAALVKWARTLADPDWCLSVPTEAKQALTRLADALDEWANEGRVGQRSGQPAGGQ